MFGYAKVSVINNLFEAQVIGPILEERQIPFYLKSYYDSAYNGLFQGQKGWGAIYAPRKYAPEIIELITSVRMKVTEPGDEK